LSDTNVRCVGKFSLDAPTIDKEVQIITKVNNYLQ